MLNSKGKRRKVSQIEQRLNRYLVVFLLLLVLSSLLCALLQMASNSSTSIANAWYLRDVLLVDTVSLLLIIGQGIGYQLHSPVAMD